MLLTSTIKKQVFTSFPKALLSNYLACSALALRLYWFSLEWIVSACVMICKSLWMEVSAKLIHSEKGMLSEYLGHFTLRPGSFLTLYLSACWEVGWSIYINCIQEWKINMEECKNTGKMCPYLKKTSEYILLHASRLHFMQVISVALYLLGAMFSRWIPSMFLKETSSSGCDTCSLRGCPCDCV